MDASKSFNSPGGDEEEARLLVTDQSLNTPESNSAASSIKSSPEPERAAPNIFDNDAHRLVQQPQMSDDQSSNDDSSSEGRRSPNLSGYNPDSDGSSPDDGDDISYYYEGEHRPRAQGKIDL